MGTSYLTCIVYVAQEDHPHAYGDKFDFTNAKDADKGSSPRVWGQDSAPLSFIYLLRIIPTRMGTSSKSRAVRNR